VLWRAGKLRRRSFDKLRTGPATAKQKEDEPGEADLKNYTFDNVEKLNRISGIKNVVPENVKINGKLCNEVVKEQNPLGISDNN
jgi:hypothetical protein